MQRPDHREHKERSDLFPFIVLGLEEEDLPEFAAALDRYVAKVLLTEAAYLENHPTAYGATALTGKYWYGQGWKDASAELEESAGRLSPEA